MAPQPRLRAAATGARENLSTRHTLRVDSRAASPSLDGRPRRRRALPGRLTQNVQVHGQLAHLALEPVTFSLTQRVFLFAPARKANSAPSRNRCRHPLPWLFQPVMPRRVSCPRLSLQKVQHQRCAALSRPVPRSAVRLPFATSSGLSTLSYLVAIPQVRQTTRITQVAALQTEPQRDRCERRSSGSFAHKACRGQNVRCIIRW
jgi:hypothetical protein